MTRQLTHKSVAAPYSSCREVSNRPVQDDFLIATVRSHKQCSHSKTAAFVACLRQFHSQFSDSEANFTSAGFYVHFCFLFFGMTMAKTPVIDASFCEKQNGQSSGCKARSFGLPLLSCDAPGNRQKSCPKCHFCDKRLLNNLEKTGFESFGQERSCVIEQGPFVR